MSFVFVCNICGAENKAVRFTDLDRETGRCNACGSVVRLRSLAHLLGLHLFGEPLPIREWPENHDIVGYGVSDWPVFGRHFGSKITYVNTQFDPEVAASTPVMDVTRPPRAWQKTADFVICSEVLEHVAPPVQLAFDGLFSLLKPGGRLIFSVPYLFDQTIEHFPDLYNWSIEQAEGQPRRLVNVTRENDGQIFDNLCFHGGGTAVLEMRVFGFDDLKARLRAAGFVRIHAAATPYKPFGIRFARKWSLPIVAQRPMRSRAIR